MYIHERSTKNDDMAFELENNMTLPKRLSLRTTALERRLTVDERVITP
jgi:hypothetical protein